MATQTGTDLPAAFDRLNLGIALYDPDTGRIVDANDHLSSLFGYDPETLCTLDVDRYTANTGRFSAAVFRDHLRDCAAGDPQRFTWRVKRGDGTLIRVRYHLSRRYVEGRTCVRAEIRDVTERYDTSHREELFWRLLRHNLRNETTVLAGYSAEIRDRADSRPLRRAAAAINRAAANLGGIADSVSEIRQAVARTADERVRRRAAAAVRSVADEVVATHGGTVAVTERDALWIHVDEAFDYALRQAIENAVVHAETPDPTVDVAVGPSPNTGRVEIAVRDRNPHVPASELDALFDRESTTNTSHGSGVGLFVTKWCIESLGGEIRFDRREPRGNTVRFYLPPEDEPTAA